MVATFRRRHTRELAAFNIQASVQQAIRYDDHAGDTVPPTTESDLANYMGNGYVTELDPICTAIPVTQKMRIIQQKAAPAVHREDST